MAAAKVRPEALDLEENNAAPMEVDAVAHVVEALPPSPSKGGASTPQPMLSPMSRFHQMNSHLETHVAAATQANKSAKKLSSAAANALGAFMNGGQAHSKEANLCHVAQEILWGARKLQVQRMRELIATIPEYAKFSGLLPKPKGDEFMVTIVLDPYGKNESLEGLVSPSTTLGELYEQYPIPGYKFDRIGIMIQGYQAPVGYKGFMLCEFDHLKKKISKIFIAPMTQKWQKDKVLDSPSAHAYNTLQPFWYERK